MTVEELERDFGAEAAAPVPRSALPPRRSFGRQLVLIGALVFAAAEFASVAVYLQPVPFGSIAAYRWFIGAVQSVAGAGVAIGAIGWYLFHESG